MMTLSIDLGKFTSVACFFDKATQKHRFATIQTQRLPIEQLLATPGIDQVVMESCGPSGWIHDICQEKGLPTIVCSTNEEAWAWKNTKRKTDRDDALKLAQMAMLNTLVPVHVPQPKVREQRAIIKYRKTLDQDITKIKNNIRSIFANRGIPIDTGERAWCTGRVHIDSFRKPIIDCDASDIWKGQLDLQLERLDDLIEKMAAVEERLEAFMQDNPHIARVMSIPGVGRKTAEMIVAYIDDPHRFHNSRQLSSYIGLTPKQHQSGTTDRNGKISKHGPKLLRSALLQCAWSSLRYNPWSKLTYERIHGGSKTRRKKAAIALARKICVVAWAMMRDETAWDQSKVLPSAAETETEVTTASKKETGEKTSTPRETNSKVKTVKKPKLKRAAPKPPGPVYSEAPQVPSGRGSKSRKRFGAPRRAPVKT